MNAAENISAENRNPIIIVKGKDDVELVENSSFLSINFVLSPIKYREFVNNTHVYYVNENIMIFCSLDSTRFSMCLSLKNLMKSF